MKFRLEDVQGVTEQELRSNPALSKHFLSRREDGEENQKDDLIRVEFTVGCGTTGVDRRLEAALATFLEGERSRLTLRVFIEPKFNSRQGGEPLWLTVVAVVQLVNLVQAEPMWRWFPETRFKYCFFPSDNEASHFTVSGVITISSTYQVGES